MSQLEHLTPNVAVHSILTDGLGTVAIVQWFGSEILTSEQAKAPAHRHPPLYQHVCKFISFSRPCAMFFMFMSFGNPSRTTGTIQRAVIRGFDERLT